MEYTNNERKIFVNYAIEIINNIKKEFKTEITTNDLQLKWFTIRILSTMALNEDNINYINLKKFIPVEYNKDLFNNGVNNTYNSLWFTLKDKQHETIVNQAFNKIGGLKNVK